METIKRKNKVNTFIAVIIMLAFFICSSESLIVGTNSSQIAWSIYKSVHYIIFIALVIRLIIVKGPIFNISISLILVIISIFGNFIFSSGPNVLSTYLHIIVVIVNAWLITEQFSENLFFDIFEKSIFVMAVYSLIIYVIALIFPSIIKMFPIIKNIAGKEYYCTGLAIISQSGLNSGTLFRSFGVFREPGVYQIFLNIAFCIYLFKFKKNNILKIIVYVLSILSTVSTTGIFAMIVIFIVFTIISNVKNKQIIVTILIAFLILLQYLVNNYDIFHNAITKINNDDDMSTIARLYSLFANLKIWITYPIFGSGMKINSTMFPAIVYQETGQLVADNTNSYMYLLSCFGIIPFIVFIKGLYCASKCMLNNGAIFLLIILLIVLAGENLIYSSFAWIFVFYGLSTTKKHLKISRIRS